MARKMCRRSSSGNKGSSMLSAAATTASLLLMSTLDGGNSVVVTAAAMGAAGNQHRRRLPQHRVRAPKRQVPYPENHPLGRHLKQIDDIGDLQFEEEDEDDSIVGGDASRSRQRRRQQPQQQRGLLRLLNPLSDNASTKRRRRQRKADDMQSEVIQEGQLKENDDVTLTYWSISGRNLVDSVNATDGQGGSDESLLMDAGKIHDENEEASITLNNEGEVSVHSTEHDRGDSEHDEQIENPTAVTAPLHNQSMGNDNDSEREDGKHDSVVDGTITIVAAPSEDEFDTNQYYNQESPNPDHESPEYEPIRLRAIFTDDPTSGSKYLTPSQRKILMEDIINPALFAWSKALHLIPLPQQEKLVVDRSQLYDGVSCGPGLDSGLPSVRVPREHLMEGLGDTDTIMYISVSFSDKSVSSLPAGNGSTESASDPPNTLYHLHRGAPGPKYGGLRRRENVTSLFSAALDNNGTTEHPSYSPSHHPSVAPTEAEPHVVTRPTCPGTYLASATYCSTDQYDRPVAGILSLCIGSHDVHNFFHNPEQVQRNIVTIMHEIGHILGFNAQSLANMRNPDSGEPLTKRDANGDVPGSEVECTGVLPRSKSEIPLPSEAIMEFRSVRGGVRVATIVTPTVQRVARNMFGCRRLVGAELASGEGQLFLAAAVDSESLSPGECIGDHWSRRLFRTDLMNPIVDDVQYSLYISSLTLAYFADTGWYKVDADRIAPPAMWGRNAGCDFVENTCVTSNGHVTAGNNPFFCNNFLEFVPEEERAEQEDEILEIHGCSLDSSRKAMCSLVEYESDIPKEYDYFIGDKYLDHTVNYGGSDPTLDYCPVFEGFTNGQCSDDASKKPMEGRSSLEVFGEDNSRCVMGHVDKKRTALCLPIACVIQEQSLMVKVDGYWKPCSYSGQIQTVWWNRNDYVVCPEPSRMCPTFFCPSDCFAEGGTCDYQTGQCMCATVHNSSFSNYYSYQRFQPCDDHKKIEMKTNGTFQLVERIDFELPDYYVENITVLLDDRRDFDDKVSRMFSQLSSGEVVGLVASFMFCAIFSFIIWSQAVRCYKLRLYKTPLSKVKSSVISLSGLLGNSSCLPWDDGHGSNDLDSPPPSYGRAQGGRNPEKDKMVATLLVQMRTEGLTAVAGEEQQLRLQLGGLASSTMLEDDSDTKKLTVKFSSNTQTIVDLSSSSDEEVLVYRSDLPPLPAGGRVLAVVGAHIVEDEIVDDARSSVTSATHVTSPSLTLSHQSEFSSPLYHDASEGRSGRGRMLRLRRHME